jgi:hypothetical protein
MTPRDIAKATAEAGLEAEVFGIRHWWWTVDPEAGASDEWTRSS